LWDNRRAMPGVPIKVTVSQAADLLMREPDEWTLPTASELALVNSEIKVRTAPPAAAEGKE
jgi:hypothetical protein